MTQNIDRYLKEEIDGRLSFWFGIHPNRQLATTHLLELLSSSIKEHDKEIRKKIEKIPLFGSGFAGNVVRIEDVLKLIK